MIAACKVCLELVDGGPVDVLGEGRGLAEFLRLAEALRAHVYARHRDAIAPYAGVVHLAVCYLASHFGGAREGSAFELEQAALLAGLVERLQSARVDPVEARAPVLAP